MGRSPKKSPKKTSRSSSESKLTAFIKARPKKKKAPTENQDIGDIITELKTQLSQTVDMFNKNKTDTKKTYARIQQLRGALDVLSSLEADYTLFPKHALEDLSE
jgi:hypothetical protein